MDLQKELLDNASEFNLAMQNLKVQFEAENKSLHEKFQQLEQQIIKVKTDNEVEIIAKASDLLQKK
jgi:hypothetical protein